MPTARADDIVEVLPPEPLSPLQKTVRSIAPMLGVDPQEIERIIQKEGSSQVSVSPKGAIGVMQLMPGTAKDMGVDPRQLQQNIEGGTRYYRQLLDKYRGDRRLAMAAYNAGPGAVDRSGGVPPYPETQRYVSGVASTGAPPVSPTVAPPATAPPIQESAAPTGAQRPAAPQGSRAQEPTVRMNEPISYDPVWGDPSRGPGRFGKLQILGEGLVDISAATDVVPQGGGPKVTAVMVRSPMASDNGWWTVEGRKLDPSRNWVRVGLGSGAAGGGEPTLRPGRNRDTGQSGFFIYNQDTRALEEVPGAGLADVSGVAPVYIRNKRTGESYFADKGSLTADSSTGKIKTWGGDEISEIATPQQAYAASKAVENNRTARDTRIHGWYGQAKDAANRGEQRDIARNFGVPMPPEYTQSREQSLMWLEKYRDYQLALSEIQFGEDIDTLNRDLNQLTVTKENSIAEGYRRKHGLAKIEPQEFDSWLKDGGRSATTR